MPPPRRTSPRHGARPSAISPPRPLPTEPRATRSRSSPTRSKPSSTSRTAMSSDIPTSISRASAASSATRRPTSATCRPTPTPSSRVRRSATRRSSSRSRTAAASAPRSARCRPPIRSPARSTNCRPRPMPLPARPAGGVSQLDVENSLRFDNKLMVYDTTPQGLLNILNWGAGLSANNGGFPQIGGVKYSFDPDLPGNSGATPGSRIRDVALIDDDGNVIAVVVDDGVVVAGAPALIQAVTLNFTANGGDGYPVKANGDNFRYLLKDGTLSAPVSEALDFTAAANVPANALGEQKAFGDYMHAVHSTPATAYDQADTPQTLDTRIQNLNVRDDTVFSSPAIAGTSGGDVLTGTVGNDTIDGLAGNDFLFGNALNDVLMGGAGADFMVGGAGDDTYFVDDNDGVLENVNEGNDTVSSNIHLVLQTNVENLVLQGSADLQGYGNNLANRLDGNTGNNLLNGGVGADVMVGHAGSDVYFVDDIGDQVIESAGEGNDAVFSTVDFTLSANVEFLVLQGSADLQGHGNDLANALYGNTGNNLLDGGTGFDFMVGGAGDDTYTFDGSDAVIENASEGNDTVLSTTHYMLATNVEHLVLQGSADLQGYGNSLANRLDGNTGNNLLNGGVGADVMAGGAGGDAYFVDDPGDTVVENAGEGSDAVFSTVNFTLAATWRSWCCKARAT